MDVLSLRDFCCLICCPPLPSRIVSKVAFLPPHPTYSLSQDENSFTGYKFTLTQSAEWFYSEREKEKLEGFFAKTSRKNQIACLFVRCTPDPKYTIIYSHGNAVDLGLMCSFYYKLGCGLNCNIFGYEYSGYGASSGKPSEKKLYLNIKCAWKSLIKKYNIKPENIILYGQSIGTVPSVYLATKHKVGAVILHSPLSSGMRFLFPNLKRNYFFDVLSNISRIHKITCPVLIIHGKEDNIVSFSHGMELYKKCRHPVEPLWVKGAGHNDIDFRLEYMRRLKEFIFIDL